MVTRKRCGFCQHEDREELERMLENKEITCDELDAKYGWRSGTAAQHQRNHMEIMSIVVILSVYYAQTQ